MQINDANLHGASQASTSRAERAPGADPAAKNTGKNSPAGATADAVEISSFAQQISDLQDGSPAREARVEELRQLVADGRYDVDSQALAKKIVSDEFGVD